MLGLKKSEHMVIRFKFAFFTVILSAAVFCSCMSVKTYPELGSAASAAPFPTGTISGTLENGLRYYIFESTEPEGSAIIALAVNAGSAQEPDGKQGVANFAGHVVDSSAETDVENTVFKVEVPVENDGGVRRIPQEILSMVNERTYNAEFTNASAGEVRLRLLSGYREKELLTDFIIDVKIKEIIYQGSPYRDHANVLGSEETIESAAPSELEKFYTTWYRPDNMALIFVGDFDGAALEEQIIRTFDAPPGKRPFDRVRYGLPLPEKNITNVEYFTNPGLTSTSIQLFYKMSPKPRSASIENFHDDMINDIVSEILDKRFKQLVEKNPSILNIYFRNIGVGRSSRFFELGADITPGGERDALLALLKEKENLFRLTVSEQEFNLEKENYLSRLSGEAEVKRESSVLVNDFIEYYLKNKPIPDVEWKKYAANILFSQIKNSEISDALHSLFTPNDLMVFICGSDGENLPKESDVKRLVREAAQKSTGNSASN
ncbi:hypothetical protein AGMMS50212_01910 [Spirochaetia bacterium]|nr:hypothetical protein AGMMS50212_01910 [Spirochaetia bacterium]